MCQNPKIAIWNANGLPNHWQEIKSFIINHNLDIMLISETHFTSWSYIIKIPKYDIYHTRHPDGKAHGGTAIIVRAAIKHHEINKYSTEHLQATSIVIEDWSGPITISSIYTPPKHSVKQNQYQAFFDTLGNKFIAGGDWNAKHPNWGSRIPNYKGRELLKSITSCNYQHLSTGEPTYWPSDRAKLPDLLDFCVVKNIALKYMNAVSCLDLSSDHSPVVITLNTQIVPKVYSAQLCNNRTDWDCFRDLLTERTNLNIPLKTEDDLNWAVEYTTRLIQNAVWDSTPSNVHSNEVKQLPTEIKNLIATKRKLRRIWQTTRLPLDKTRLNRASTILKKKLKDLHNSAIQKYLEELSPMQDTDYSLWKATKIIRQPQKRIPPIRTQQGWARIDEEKCDVFAAHFVNVFQPHPAAQNEDEKDLYNFLEAPFQMDMPIQAFSKFEVKNAICNLAPKKSPGYDLITGQVLNQLNEDGIRLITSIFNAVLRLRVFPEPWKVGQIILIPKPGKPAEEVSSYRPISLLPILSKLFERLFLSRLLPVIESKKLIPSHQFGFRNQHATIEQIHRVINVINLDLHKKRYCSAAFLDITQAFDKVWHLGLLYKIKRNIPYQFYEILKSYLSQRFFQIKCESSTSDIQPISAGVPQGSVLGPILYLLYTADLPTLNSTVTATFADDTVILASDDDHIIASNKLQNGLNGIQEWLKKWRMKANENKSVHVTFTLRRSTCPPVTLNNNYLPQADDAKYLGMHLDRRLTWRKHIWTKRKQLGIKLIKLNWLIGRKSQLSIDNKLLLYKSILKPIWTYGIQLWGSASSSNIEILQRFQSKTLRSIVNAPWYVSNDIIHRDLCMPKVKSEISLHSENYHKRLFVHPNELAVNLLNNNNIHRRLKRINTLDLPRRFQ